MEQEFGLDIDGDIYCKYGFTKDMEINLPKNRIILIENGLWEIDYYIKASISEGMIEEELDPKDYPQYFV